MRLPLSCLSGLVLALLAPPFASDPPSDAMSPVAGPSFELVRHELHAGRGSSGRSLLRAVRDLAENRLDVDALPWGTPITVWTMDDDIVSFQLGAATPGSGEWFAGEGLFAAKVDDHGAQRWVLDDGTSLDGPMLARPVRYQSISSKIGVREHPIRKRTRFHAGTDYAAPIGTPVRVIADGVVKRATQSATAGKLVVVLHDDGTETKYMHLDAHAQGIRDGVRVRQGEVIGTVGQTGRVTGPHLHFELRDRWRTPLDPRVTRFPASFVVDARTLRLFALRKDLLQTFRADGSRDLAHPLVATRHGVQGHTRGEDGRHVFLISLAGPRTASAQARLKPLPSRRRKRALFTARSVFDEVDDAHLADDLCARAVKLAAEFPDHEHFA